MSRTTLFLTAASILGGLALGMTRPAQRLLVKPPLLQVTRGGGPTITAQTTHEVVSANGGEVSVQIDVSLPMTDRARHSIVSMALVIDRSGSMEGEKLERAKRAARALVEKLGPEDHLAIVHFGSDATVMPLHVMNEAGRIAALSLIGSIRAEGGTNLGEGLREASQQLFQAPGNRRLVLASDGNPTVGITNTAQLLGYAGSTHDRDGVSITALGIGADYNGQFMMGLAERGCGFYGYIAEPGQLDEVLAQEVEQARSAALRNVKLALKPGSGVSIIGVPGRALEGGAVRLPDLKPGDSARIFVQLRVGPHAPEAALPLLSIDASGVGVINRREAGSGVAMTLTTSSDATVVAASKNEPVFANAVSAIGSMQLVAAAEALEAGDAAKATSLLEIARSIFATSTDALAGNQEVMERTKASPTVNSARLLQRKSMQAFGEQNGY